MSPRESSKEWRPTRLAAAPGLGRQIDHVYLFHTPGLLAEQRAHGAKAGTAASVRKSKWDAAKIYPAASNRQLLLTERQTALLGLFRPS